MSPAAAALAAASAALVVTGCWPHRPGHVALAVPAARSGSRAAAGLAARTGGVALALVPRATGRPVPPSCDPQRVGRALLAGGGACVVSPVLALAVVPLVWGLPALAARRAAARRAAEVRRSLPEAVDLLGLAVGAGLTVHLALHAVSRRAPGPVGAALARLLAEVDAGRRLGDALAELPRHLGEDARPLAAALVASERYGAPLGPGLERLAGELRADRRRRAEEAARRVPVKLLFPLVCCILPAFALLTVAPLLAGALRSLRL